jgi:hypothetical protein
MSSNPQALRPDFALPISISTRQPPRQRRQCDERSGPPERGGGDVARSREPGAVCWPLGTWSFPASVPAGSHALPLLKGGHTGRWRATCYLPATPSAARLPSKYQVPVSETPPDLQALVDDVEDPGFALDGF